ncbi:MAG TPA: helix-turn-helix domain-containing protein [Thermoplasmata archaeon]|nr:helix-turn-helix domain-containing protein [Thermoplasmata archaeon]
MSEVRARANALLQESLGSSMERIGGTLRDLGLTGNAADAFCTLVRMGRATARELVVKTGIPDSKIYYALAELADKGLIEVQGGKPKTYRIVPPREVELRLGRIVEEDYERRRAATTRLGSILEPLRAAAESPSTDVAYIVKGLPNVVSRARSLITSARKEIVFLASDESLFRKVEPDLGKAARRRVRVQLAIPDIKVEKDLEKGAEVRSIVCDCMLLVADGQQVLTITRTSDGDAYGITSTDPTLVRLGLEYWESPRCCVV